MRELAVNAGSSVGLASVGATGLSGVDDTAGTAFGVFWDGGETTGPHADKRIIEQIDSKKIFFMDRSLPPFNWQPISIFSKSQKLKEFPILRNSVMY
jgi:hypothetical protein